MGDAVPMGGSFTRAGPLTLSLLVTLLLYMVADAGRSGYEQLLDAVWDAAVTARLALLESGRVSGAAFCKARRRIPPGAIRILVHRVASVFGRRLGPRMRWLNGRRVFAVDGTKLNLQRRKQLADAYRGMGVRPLADGLRTRKRCVRRRRRRSGCRAGRHERPG